METTLPPPHPPREAVDKDFIEACYFLRDHMDNVSEPGDEMVILNLTMEYSLLACFRQWCV